MKLELGVKKTLVLLGSKVKKNIFSIFVLGKSTRGSSRSEKFDSIRP